MAKKAEVIITCDGTTAKQVLEGINRELARAIKEREQLLQKQKQNGTLTQEEIKRDKELQKYISALNTQQQRATQEMRKYGEVMKDLSGSKLKDLKKALREGKQALENMSAKSKGREKLMSDLQKIQNQINKLQGTTTSFGKTHNSVWQTAVRNITAYVGVFAAFNKVKSLVEGVFKANLQLSDSLANIRKVSGLSMESVNQLYRNIAKIDSRNTIETLNNLAYTGAKLGIGQNYGVEGLTGFVKAAEQVQMALGEDMGEDALPALAKMTEVMGLIDKYGVEQSMQKAASAIFQLGATSTATGTNIVEFSKRLYGLANVSRISTDDLLALGSAADAMGLMPEVAATAFNKLFTSVQRQHNLIEQSLGMQNGRIKELYDEGKTMDAIVEIFEKMNQKGNLNLLGTVFKDLGSDGARLVNVMATMADRVDILKKHLETSRDAFKEGEAVIGEYMIQNQTAQALMERSSNLWAKAFTNPEGVDMVKQMAQAWYDLSKSMTQSDAQMKSLHTSINLIALAVETLIKLLPFLIRGLMLFGVAAAIRGVVTGIGGMVTAIREATSAQLALNTAMKSNWFLAIASGIAAALTLLYDYSKAAEEAAQREAKRQAELKASFEKSREAVEGVVKPLGVYKKALDDATLSEKQRMELVKQFKNDYQDYLDYLGIEITSAVDLAKAYAQVVKVMKQKKAYEERESFRQQRNGDNRMNRISNQAQVEAQLQSMGITGIDKSWLEQNQRLGTKGMYDKIMRQKYGTGAWEVTGTGRGRWAIRDSKGKIKEVGSEALWDIIDDYIGSYRTERDTNKQIDAMFNSEYGDIDLANFDIDEFNDRVQRARWKRKGSLDNEKPDKSAAAAAKKAAQEAKQAMRKEMEDAQKESTGVLSKLEEWYRLQEAAITEARADGKMTEEQATQMVNTLNIIKNESLATARRAITTGDTAAWDELKTNIMPKAMADASDLSKDLLETIQNVPVKALHDNLAKFNGDAKKVFGLDSRAFFDQINAKAAGNTREVARLRAKMFKEAEKIIKQYDIIDGLTDKLQKDMETIGFVTETYEEFAQRTILGLSREQMRKQSATKQMEADFNNRYGIGSKQPQNMAEWFREFSDNGNAEWAKTLPLMQQWVRDTDRYKEDIQNLYTLLSKLQRGQAAGMNASVNSNRQQVSAAIGEAKTDKQYFADAGFKFMGMGTLPYRINIENEQEALQWLRDFGTTASGELEDFAKAMPQMKEMIEQVRKAGVLSPDAEIGPQQLESLRQVMPLIQALYYEMESYASNVGSTIQKQVQQMTNRTPIGIDDMRAQHQQQVNLTNTLWQQKINEANASDAPKNEEGDTDAAVELKMQRDQQLINMEYQFQQQLYQIREQMGVTWQEEYENELAMYQNMLDKKLISEQQFQSKKGKLQVQQGIKYGQYYNNLMSNFVNALQDYEIAAVEAKYDKEIAAARANGQDTAALEEQKEAEIYEIRRKYAALMLAVKISEIIMNTATGIMMAYASLPTPAAIVASSLIAATGALQLALAKAEYDKVMGGGTGGSKAPAGNTTKKLTSGMLTYDKGNVQRFIGQDGKVYTATEEPQPKDGLVTHPIATTVQGQPALVAENGPEIVIGRETTKAIMMNEPQLIKYLADYGKTGGFAGGWHPYDSGNVESVANQPSDVSPQTSNDEMQRTLAALTQTVALLQQQLAKGIKSSVNMYGTDGLYENMQKANKFMSKYQ